MKADSGKVKRRLNIIRGQVEGIIKMVEEDRYCIDISNQIIAVISALKSLNQEVLSAHLSHCVQTGLMSGDEEDMKAKLDEIKDVIKKLSR